MKKIPQNIFDGYRLANTELRLMTRQIHLYIEGIGSAEHHFLTPMSENLYSGSKTYTAVAIGMAQDEGLLKIEDPLADYFPEFEREMEEGRANGAYKEGWDKVTIRDLLQMRSGKTYMLFKEKSLRTEEDYAALYFRDGIEREPGTYFFYNNINSYMLGRVIHKVSGQNLCDFLEARLFKPLGYFNVLWQSCPQGYSFGAAGIFLKTHEYAQLGRFLLQEGEWEGKQLLSADYVRRMRADLADTSLVEAEPETTQGYGYQVWKGSHEENFRADGMYGQFSLIYPKERVVVTITARNEQNPYRIIQAAQDEILPRLGAL